MALLTGPIQGLACIGIGLLLIVYAEVRRSRELRGLVVVPHPAT
jgi:hypothetical protein